MSGIYAVYYTGNAGSGFAVFIMRNGEISGSDSEGCLIDGTYKKADGGKISISVTLKAPLGGASLVTGPLVDEGFSQQITAKIPENFYNGSIIPLQTTTGPVNAVFKWLRDIS